MEPGEGTRLRRELADVLARLADCVVAIPANNTPLIQEAHMIVTHLLCGLVEATLSDEASA